MTQAAAQEISVAAYAFSSKYLGNALIAAMKRGVKIRLILDRGNAEKSYSLDEWLIENGIDIRFLKVKSGCMHHKFMIIDRIRLMAGSYNFTNDSEFRNHEAALFINATETTDITTSIAATAKDMTGHNTKAPAGEHAATVNPDTSKTKASDIVKRMRKDHGVSIAAGQGDELKDKIIRIAHMGWVNEQDLIMCFSLLEKVLVDLGYKLKVGASVARFQEVIYG